MKSIFTKIFLYLNKVMLFLEFQLASSNNQKKTLDKKCNPNETDSGEITPLNLKRNI